MSTLLYMPEVLANTTHATISRWLIQAGDEIKIGQCIAEVETDKALVDMLAEQDALVSRLLAKEGEEVAVGAPIARLNGDDASEDELTMQSQSIATKSNTANDMAQNTVANDAMDAISTKRIFASPVAKRMAAQNQVDLAILEGSGPKGRIVKRDIEAQLQKTRDISPAKAVDVAEPITTPIVAMHENGSNAQSIPLSSMRKTIAKRLTESKSTVPHFYLQASCQMDALLALRQDINAVASEKISVNDLLIKACAQALMKVPMMNVAWANDHIVQFNEADISVAVATDKGLLTPVIHQAQTLSVSAIHAQMADLAKSAKEGRLSPEQYQGGCFSISNLGMYGVDNFSAILNPPQAGILAVGGIQKMPVVKNDEIIIASVMNVTLSVDHRVVDGAVAAQWLAALKNLLESPMQLLV